MESPDPHNVSFCIIVNCLRLSGFTEVAPEVSGTLQLRTHHCSANFSFLVASLNAEVVFNAKRAA